MSTNPEAATEHDDTHHNMEMASPDDKDLLVSQYSGPVESWDCKYCCPSLCSCIALSVFCPFCILCSFKTVNVGEEAVFLNW